METVYSLTPGWLPKTFLLARGLWLYLIHINTPFDSDAYIREYGFHVEEKTEKKKGNAVNYPAEKYYTRISGWWLRFPRLHYYTFNSIKETRATGEVERTKAQLCGILQNSRRGDGAVLIVLHELSRTGAPILGVELARRISQFANVIVLSLKSGPLEEVLKNLEIPVIVIDWKDELTRSPLFNMVVREGKVNRAIVNSICSYPVIDLLEKKQIPIVSLVHEFSSYVADKEVFPLIHDVSRAVFYPAALVAEDAYRQDPGLGKSNVRIEPQGLIKAPATRDAAVIAAEKEKITANFRGDGARKPCVVLGVGTIEPRKGVDLFISTAQSILRSDNTLPFRFVWIGSAINKVHREEYEVYLRDQIRRAGLSGHVHIMDPIQNLQAAFAEADLFFLSSRLDPLPLVSIEAMELGLPLVCFEGASGIADYLKESPEASSTVVPYLDTESAARSIRELIDDVAHRTHVGSVQQKFSRRRFDMDAYTSKILREFGNV
jgi:glycosyltransferase involved in cell wall biosynthesis